MKISVDTKKMNAIVKTIHEKINVVTENRNYECADKMFTYGVEIIADKKGAYVEVVPNNGETFYCIADLVKIADFFETSYYVTIKDGKVCFRITTIVKH